MDFATAGKRQTASQFLRFCCSLLGFQFSFCRFISFCFFAVFFLNLKQWPKLLSTLHHPDRYF